MTVCVVRVQVSSLAVSDCRVKPGVCLAEVPEKKQLRVWLLSLSAVVVISPLSEARGAKGR